MGSQGVLLMESDPDRAMAHLKEQERICRELGRLPDLQRSLLSQALILQTSNPASALALHQEQVRICRQLGAPYLWLSLREEARFLQARGDPGDLHVAVSLLEEQVRVSRELGEPTALALGLASYAECLLRAGRPAEALPLIEESITIAPREDRFTTPEDVKLRSLLLDRIRAALVPKSSGVLFLIPRGGEAEGFDVFRPIRPLEPPSGEHDA